jgi:hypothetical protein
MEFSGVLGFSLESKGAVDWFSAASFLCRCICKKDGPEFKLQLDPAGRSARTEESR